MDLNNRKFQYGDGFFETIIVRNGNISFFSDHLERIKKACITLKFEIPNDFKNILKNDISNACEKFKNSRVKIHFFRNSEGLYTPEQNALDYIIQVEENKTPFFREIEEIGISLKSRIFCSEFSSFKCIVLPYILAGIEKKSTHFNELILLNTQGFIADCISSNIFWVKNGEYFTPSIESGCVDGIMRKNVIKTIKNKGFRVIEGLFTEKELQDCEHIFTTNVTGIASVKTAFGKSLKAIDKSFFHLV